jgi:hypothetical protein
LSQIRLGSRASNEASGGGDEKFPSQLRIEEGHSAIGKTGNGARQNIDKPPFVTFRLADSLPRELLDDWLRASSSLKLRRTSRDAFLAANPPPWDDLTEACDHGPFSDKLGEPLAAAHGPCAL